MKQRKFYRNIVPINEIEEYSLWELKNNILVLVDDDNYEMLPLKNNEANFKEVFLSETEIKSL